jgi:hypothetical protein
LPDELHHINSPPDGECAEVVSREAPAIVPVSNPLEQSNRWKNPLPLSKYYGSKGFESQ